MLAQVEGPALQGPPTTMYEMINTASLKYTDNTALVSIHQLASTYPEIDGLEVKSDCLRWSHKQLRRGAELLALALSDLGLRKGEPVAVFLNNVAEWSLFLYTTLILNVPFVNCNPRSAPNADEIRHVLKTSGARVLVTTNEELALRLEEVAPTEMKSMKLKILLGQRPHCSNDSSRTISSYEYLGALLSKAARELDLPEPLRQLESIPREPDDTVVILFTSGTTSLPKGCAHTNKTFTANLRSYVASLSIESKSRVVMNHAVNTISGPVFIFAFLTSGATVVHPSLHFDAAASNRAAQAEECSHIGTVTTMLQLQLEHPSLSSIDFTSLKIVFCGGSNVLYSHAAKVRDILGAKLRIVYGLTEAPASTNGYAEVGNNSKSHYETPSTGPPAPGSRIRICDPKTRRIMKHGERGELHQSGPLIIQQYIGNVSPESFYSEGDELWFRTGDEALLTEEGEIRITGRFKDLILRGGANVSPVTIENTISKELGLDSQVIGIDDTVAGEVPIAIVKADQTQQQYLSAIRQTVLQKLGTNYALADVVLLNHLGLEDWPKTTSGKVRKTELRTLTSKYMAKARESVDKYGGPDVATIVKNTWTAMTGVPVHDIEEEISVNELADSLTISRLASQLQQALGQNVSLQDLLEHPTLHEQITMLQSRKENPLSDLVSKRNGPPLTDDMVHTHGDELRARRTQTLCEPVLRELGLSWSEDVKDVMPLYDYARTELRFGTTNTSIEISQTYIARDADVIQLSRAVKAGLEAFDTMRTVAIRFDEDVVLLVVLRASERWYKICLNVLSEPLETIDDFKHLKIASTGPWGKPLVRLVVAFVKESNSAGLSLNMSHATGDGISWASFFETIGTFLNNNKDKAPLRVPYKLFADEKYTFRSSNRADALVLKYNNAFKGIGTRMTSYWPPSLESMWSCGTDCLNYAKVAPSGFAKRPDRFVKPSDRAVGSEVSVRGEIELCDIRELQASRGIPPPVLGRAALMLFAAMQTQQPHVLIGEVLSGRSSWPVSTWISNRLPSPLDIDGPAYTLMPYYLVIDRGMKVLELLQQMTQDQNRLVEDSHLPQIALHKALNEGDPTAAENFRDGDVMTNGMHRLMLNWLPVMANLTAGIDEEPAMKCVRNIVRSPFGVAMRMGLKPDGKTLSLGAVWIDVALDDQERANAVQGILKLAQKLSDKATWQTSVGTVMQECA